MRKIILLLLLIPAVVFSQDIGGDYYVATDGSDSNAGTYAAPFATWQKAVTVAQAGDTVYIRGGVYLPTLQAINTAYEGGNHVIRFAPSDEYIPGRVGYNGTPNNYICYFAYPGEEPILDCKNITTDGGFNNGFGISFAHFLHFKGLTIRNVYQQGTPTDSIEAFGINAYGATNIIYENLKIYNIGGNGLRHLGGYVDSTDAPYGNAYGQDTSYFKNLDIWACVDTFKSQPGNAADGIKTSADSKACQIFRGSRVWSCSDDGFDPSGNGLMIIDSCWAWDNGHYFVGGQGTGFKFGSRSYEDKKSRIITNNISAFNKVGYTENNRGYGEMYMDVFNNVSWQDSIAFQNFINDSTHLDLPNIYMNNLAYDPSFRIVEMGSGCIHSHNSWDGTSRDSTRTIYHVEDDDNTGIHMPLSDADFATADSATIYGLFLTERTTGGFLPNVSPIQLAEGSSLIDAGTDVGISYNGDAPDIGAFEFGTSTTPPVDPPAATKTYKPGRSAGGTSVLNGKVLIF